MVCDFFFVDEVIKEARARVVTTTISPDFTVDLPWVLIWSGQESVLSKFMTIAHHSAVVAICVRDPTETERNESMSNSRKN